MKVWLLFFLLLFSTALFGSNNKYIEEFYKRLLAEKVELPTSFFCYKDYFDNSYYCQKNVFPFLTRHFEIKIKNRTMSAITKENNPVIEKNSFNIFFPSDTANAEIISWWFMLPAPNLEKLSEPIKDFSQMNLIIDSSNIRAFINGVNDALNITNQIDKFVYAHFFTPVKGYLLTTMNPENFNQDLPVPFNQLAHSHCPLNGAIVFLLDLENKQEATEQFTMIIDLMNRIFPRTVDCVLKNDQLSLRKFPDPSLRSNDKTTRNIFWSKVYKRFDKLTLKVTEDPLEKNIKKFNELTTGAFFDNPEKQYELDIPKNKFVQDSSQNNNKNDRKFTLLTIENFLIGLGVILCAMIYSYYLKNSTRWDY